MEWPPLLRPGLHSMSLKEIKRLCVQKFPRSTRRLWLMDGLETLATELHEKLITGEMWINGSFMTEKQEPDDIDIILVVDSKFIDTSTPEQRAVVQWFDVQDLEPEYYCHTFVHVEYPQSHELYWECVWERAGWVAQFGYSRMGEKKGLALLRIPLVKS